MPAIGTLKPNSKDGYAFTLKTLSKKLSGDLLPNDRAGSGAPDFRAFLSDGTEVGAAWTKEKDGRSYISMQLDDPFLAEPINANSFTREDGVTVLLWSRPQR